MGNCKVTRAKGLSDEGGSRIQRGQGSRNAAVVNPAVAPALEVSIEVIEFANLFCSLDTRITVCGAFCSTDSERSAQPEAHWRVNCCVFSSIVIGKIQKMERVAGIEPAYSAWKAAALPLSYTRKVGDRRTGISATGPQMASPCDRSMLVADVATSHMSLSARCLRLRMQSNCCSFRGPDALEAKSTGSLRAGFQFRGPSCWL